MSSAPVLETRRKVVAALKADAALTALVPGAQIYGPKTDSRLSPFISCREFESDGTTRVIGNVHAFSRATFDDEAHQILEAASEAINHKVLVLAGGRKAHVLVTGSRMLADPEESTAWHGILALSIEIPKDCGEA